MQRRAFEILGIEPTTDQRVIRNAFVRLARIYHPDRFAGMPEDVCIEAERRMKQASAAYESLLADDRTASAAASKSTKHKHDPWEEARRARENIRRMRAENENRRKRWLLWDALERQTRQRADLEARLAGDGTDETIDLTSRPTQEIPEPSPRRTLAQRLDDARDDKAGSVPAIRRSS